VHNGYKGRQITNVKTRYRTTFTRWQVKEEELIRYEEEHGIANRWDESSQEYKDALNYSRNANIVEQLITWSVLLCSAFLS